MAAEREEARVEEKAVAARAAKVMEAATAEGAHLARARAHNARNSRGFLELHDRVAAARAVRGRLLVGAPLFLLARALPLSEEGTCEGSKGTRRRHPSTHTLYVSTGAAALLRSASEPEEVGSTN